MEDAGSRVPSAAEGIRLIGLHGSRPAGCDKSNKTVTFGDSSAVSANRWASVGTVAGLGALWALSEQSDMVDPNYLPGPLATAQGFWTLLTTDSLSGTMLHEHILASLRRIGLGVMVGLLLGVPFGLVVGLSGVMRGAFDPLIGLFRHVPALTFLPLLFVWVGVGEPPLVAMLFVGAFFIIAFATYAGATSIHLTTVRAAQTLGASKRQLLRYVIAPNALPDILMGIRVAVALSWATLFAGELLGSDTGLGAMIWTAREFFDNAVVAAGIIVIGTLAVTVDVAMRQLERHLVPWQGHG